MNSYPSQNTLKAADDYADKEEEMGDKHMMIWGVKLFQTI
jgi:hypothetical protein